jgi:hypothetical protein
MMSGPLVNSSSQTAAFFQFPFIVLLRHGQGAIFNLQPSSSSPPSTLILVANFIPRRHQLQPSSPFKFQNPSLCYCLPFSLMVAVCLMLLLPDKLLTKIIIHSIKDVAFFHFLNLRNKICDTFRRICNFDEVLLHVSLRDLREACKNCYIRSCFEWRFPRGQSSKDIVLRGDGEVDEAAEPR